MHNTFARIFLYIMAAYALSALVLFSTGAFGAGYDTGFKETPLRELPPRFQFIHELRMSGIQHSWMMESNSDGSYTLNFLPERDLSKRGLRITHERTCRMAKGFPGFTLKGTTFYLPNGVLYGSPCVRADGKGVGR